MELPFELYSGHKSTVKGVWREAGLICSDVEIEEIYQQYIYSTNCELCKKKFENTKDRCMDHDHTTGQFRNVCCQSCNQRKSDVKMRSDNSSGYKNISKVKKSRYKQGFIWEFKVMIDGKQKTIKSSVDLEKVIQFRDKWFEEHPNYHT